MMMSSFANADNDHNDDHNNSNSTDYTKDNANYTAFRAGITTRANNEAGT